MHIAQHSCPLQGNNTNLIWKATEVSSCFEKLTDMQQVINNNNHDDDDDDNDNNITIMIMIMMMTT